MRNYIKKLVITGTLTLITMVTITSTTKATTVKVTGDTLNIRKSPSTSSDVVAMLFKDVECELLEEESEWYKIKYKSYTGYISKQYSKKLEETTTKNEEDNNIETNNNKENNNEITQQEITGEEEKPETTDNRIEIIYKKLKKSANAKILPLIYSDNIENLNKGSKVVLLSQITGWSYIQTDSISGWIRTENLEDTQAPADEKNDNNNYSQKTAYVNENYVNVRKGAGTSYNVIKTLALNSKVTIIGEEGSWYKVKSGSDEGFISKEYLSDSQKTTTRGNTSSRTEEKELENVKQEQKDTSNNEKTVTTTKKEDTTEVKKENTSNNTTQIKEETTKKENIVENETTVSNNKIKGTDVVAYAKKYLGYKYVYGGDGSNGTFDCSGFTMYVYKHFEISIPHGATSQYKSGKGTKISKQSDLKAGDIVFLTDYETGVGIGHCGIFIGDGNFIHASTTTYSVIISSLNGIYKGRFYAGLRLI